MEIQSKGEAMGCHLRLECFHAFLGKDTDSQPSPSSSKSSEAVALCSYYPQVLGLESYSL